MTEWQRVLLGDVITLQRGFDLTEKDATPGPYPVISSGGPGYTTDVPKVGGPGVITGRKGVLGKVHFSPGPYWPHDTTLWVKDFKGAEPRFIYYLLQTLPLASLDVGAANPTLNRNHAHLLPVTVPGPATQAQIAHSLGALDDLIENNERQVKVLEEMARAIHREWFIHFRYPGHENATFIESPHRPIPDGWERTPLAELVSTQYGYTESASDIEVGPRYLRGMDINKRSYIDWSTVPYCPIDDASFNKFRIQVGDVFVIRMADPGKVGMCEVETNAVFASYLVRMRPSSNRITSYFLFFTLSADEYQGWVTGASTGATRKSVSAKVMTEPRIVLPPRRVQQEFEDVIRPIRSLMMRLVEQNSTLRVVRSKLLPKLMTGKIDVSSLSLDALIGDSVE